MTAEAAFTRPAAAPPSTSSSCFLLLLAKCVSSVALQALCAKTLTSMHGLPMKSQRAEGTHSVACHYRVCFRALSRECQCGKCRASYLFIRLTVKGQVLQGSCVALVTVVENQAVGAVPAVSYAPHLSVVVEADDILEPQSFEG